jgi:chitinase
MRKQLTWFMLAIGAHLTACGGAADFENTAPEVSAPEVPAREASPPAEPAPVGAEAAAAGDTNLYVDGLGSGWEDWSWATHNLAATSPVASGTRAVSATFGPWTGLYFHNAGVPTAGLEFLELQVHGGVTANPTLTAYATVANQARPTVGVNRYCDGGAIKAGAWTRCRVPLSALGVANTTVDGFALQEGAGRTLPVMTFDNLRLAASAVAPTAPAGLKATPSAADVALAWSAITGATGYHVYRSPTQTGTYTKLTAAPVTGAAYRDAAVSSGATYWYTVSAVGAGGEGARSTSVSAVVRPPVPAVSIALSPTSASLALGATRTFTATVTGSTNTAVTWSVQQGPGGGTVTSGGVYTAPRTAGTYTVVATSQADTSKKATATVTVTAPTPGGGSGKWVSGYYTGWNADLYPPEKVDFSAMTHIIVGRATPRPDGTVSTAFDTSNGPAMARTLSTRAHAAGRKAIIMVGGAGEHDNWVAAASNANRAKFVQNLLSAMDSLGYDGLDIDWEPVETADKPNLLALVKELRAARPGMLLTFPIGWININETVDPWFANLVPYMDQINIMSYEMIGPWDGWQSWYTSALYGHASNRPTSVSASLDAWARVGIPKAKLGMGIPFYGMAWRNISGPYQSFTNWSDYVGSDNVFTYKKIQQLSASGTYHWDAVAAASYVTFSSPVEDGSVRWISYDSPQAIAAKGAYTRDNGFGGTIIWTINQGCTNATTGANPLLDAVKSAFLQ